MKQHPLIRSWALASVATCCGVVALANAQTPPRTPSSASVANIGTLTCALDPGDRTTSGVKRALSCKFQPITGASAEFSGIVIRQNAVTPDRAKIVLAWSVLAPDGETDLSELAGRYVGEIDTARSNTRASGLVGGTSGQIVLRPLTPDPRLPAAATYSIIELELSSMKA